MIIKKPPSGSCFTAIKRHKLTICVTVLITGFLRRADVLQGYILLQSGHTQTLCKKSGFLICDGMEITCWINSGQGVAALSLHSFQSCRNVFISMLTIQVYTFLDYFTNFFLDN